jgi:hypothetical protein
MSYAEALALLGHDDNRLVTALDHIASGAIFIGAALSGGAALTLVEAKNDLVGYGRELSRQVAARKRGLRGGTGPNC